MDTLFVVALIAIWASSAYLAWQIEKGWCLQLDAIFPSTPTCWTKKTKLRWAVAFGVTGPIGLLVSLIRYICGL